MASVGYISILPLLCFVFASAEGLEKEQPRPDLNEVPAGWISYPIPDAWSDEMYCANWSLKREWTVRLEGERLRIDSQDEVLENDRKLLPFELEYGDLAAGDDGIRYWLGHWHVLAVPDGWLIGIDSGEWGGTLIWSNHAGTRHRKLLGTAVAGFGKISTKTIAFTRALYDDGEGKAYELVRGSNGWVARKRVSIPSDPELIVSETRNSLLVLARRGLHRLDSEFGVDLLRSVNFDGLYPNSMVRLRSGELYVGMRHFVVRLVPSSEDWSEQWLVPEACRRFWLDAKAGECVCAGDVSGENK
jgi:hypothetical protein